MEKDNCCTKPVCDQIGVDWIDLQQPCQAKRHRTQLKGNIQAGLVNLVIEPISFDNSFRAIHNPVMSSLNIAVVGATGRMGKRLVTLAKSTPDLRVEDALVRRHHPELGRDVGEVVGIGAIGVKLADEISLDPQPGVLIDFSTPDSTRHWLQVCASHRIPMVIGTTGLTAADHHKIDEAALAIPVLQAANTSMGIAVLNLMAARMAKLLGDEFDIEIVETHHRYKKDSPSGTSLALADRILESTGRTRGELDIGREKSIEARPSGRLAIHSIRIGDVTGTHTVHFGGDGERLEISHSATNRDVFALGALRAAAWLAGRGAGRYRIEDVLGV